MDLSILKYFLSVEVAGNHDGLFLCQRKYTLYILSEVELLGAKHANVPIEQQHRLVLASVNFLQDPECYRRLMGCLIYLCFTRLELSHCVHVLS